MDGIKRHLFIFLLKQSHSPTFFVWPDIGSRQKNRQLWGLVVNIHPFNSVIGIVALSFLFGGCAHFQEELNRNIAPSHPLEKRFGHVLFLGNQLPYPTLKKAARISTKRSIRRAPEAESTVTPKPRKVAARAARTRVPKPNVKLPNAMPRAKLDLREVKKPTPSKALPKKRLGDGSIRSEVLAAARRLVGIQGDTFKGGGFLMHLLQVTDYQVEESADPIVKALYQQLNRNEQIVTGSATPKAGDLVFFHNTYDRDFDGRADDWFTQAGVVERTDGDGTLHFIAYSRGQIRRMVLNTLHPALQKNLRSGQDLNSFMREKNLSDRPFTSYLAGELFAAYGVLKE
jgi:hypothetical protein